MQTCCWQKLRLKFSFFSQRHSSFWRDAKSRHHNLLMLRGNPAHVARDQTTQQHRRRELDGNVLTAKVCPSSRLDKEGVSGQLPRQRRRIWSAALTTKACPVSRLDNEGVSGQPPPQWRRVQSAGLTTKACPVSRLDNEGVSGQPPWNSERIATIRHNKVTRQARSLGLIGHVGY